MGKFIDMSGQQCGHLFVLELDQNNIKGKEKYWLCKCDCGNPNTISVRGSCLRNGHTLSCGKCFVYRSIGKLFGKLLVIQEDPNNKLNFVCKCECGNIVSVSKSHLTSGHTQSCGCKKVENSVNKMVGKRIGKLIVLKPTELRTNKQEIIWECRCDCGNLTYAGTDILNKEEKISCGCLKMSKGENAIKELLEKYKIKFEQEKRFDDIKKFRFDFYVENSYIIEFDGKQHFVTKNSGWDTKEHLLKTQYNDSVKNNWCLSHNIPIIRIPYTHLKDLCIEDLQLETSKFLLKDMNINEKAD